MLHTIWMIVKIILIVLAILLGALLLLLLGLLFLPFRYKIKADNKEEWNVYAVVSWLGFFLRGKVVYEKGKLAWKVSILGIPVAPKKEKPKKEKKSKKKADKEKAAEIQEETTEEETIQIETTKAGETKNETIEVGKKQQEQKAEEQKEEAKKPDERAESLNNKKTPHLTIANRIEKIKSTFKKICAKIKYMWHNTKEWMNLLTSDRTKAAFAASKTEIFYILKKIRPRKIKGLIEFGTGDPASTGQCLGLIAMVYGYFGKDLRIVPDFEEKVLKADVVCKGKIPLEFVLLSLWRIYKNKDLRVLKRKIERLGGK